MIVDMHSSRVQSLTWPGQGILQLHFQFKKVSNSPWPLRANRDKSTENCCTDILQEVI